MRYSTVSVNTDRTVLHPEKGREGDRRTIEMEGKPRIEAKNAPPRYTRETGSIPLFPWFQCFFFPFCLPLSFCFSRSCFPPFQRRRWVTFSKPERRKNQGVCEAREPRALLTMRIEFHNRGHAGHNETKLRYNEGSDLLYRWSTWWWVSHWWNMCFLRCRGQGNNYPWRCGAESEERGKERRKGIDNGPIISGHRRLWSVTPRGERIEKERLETFPSWTPRGTFRGALFYRKRFGREIQELCTDGWARVGCMDLKLPELRQ